MKKIRLLYIVLVGILLLAIISVYVKGKKERIVEDYKFTSYSHRDVNDFDRLTFDESTRIMQPFVAGGKNLDSLMLFLKYSELPTIKDGKILVEIVDSKHNTMGQTYIDCQGIPDEGWFAWLYDFDISLNYGEVYYIVLDAIDVGSNVFELRTADSNLGVACNYPNMVYNSIERNDTVLIVTLMYTATMSGNMSDEFRDILELLGIYLIICCVIITLLSAIIRFKKELKVPLLYGCLISSIITLILGGYIYNFTQPWYQEAPIIAHALGTVDGKTYTNSKEAFLHSIGAGYKFLEADFSTTSDGHIVLRHDWGAKECSMGFPAGYVPTLEEFCEHTILNTYDSLSLLDLFVLMEKNPDIYIITDSKEGAYDTVVEQFTYIVELAEKNGYEDILKRFIVQIYNDEMLHAVESVYPFENYIYTLYQRGYTEIEQLIDFCYRNKIEVITVFDLWWYEQPEVKKKLCDSGLKIYLHTVNDVEEVIRLKGEGITNVYTDYVMPHEL